MKEERVAGSVIDFSPSLSTRLAMLPEPILYIWLVLLLMPLVFHCRQPPVYTMIFTLSDRSAFAISRRSLVAMP